MKKKLHILVIDNYDSFTFNLVYQLKHLLPQASFCIKRNKELKNIQKKLSQFNLLIIGPGPMAPKDVPQVTQLLTFWRGPVLGVCLGLQIINEYLGGKTTFSAKPIHGSQVIINFKKHPIFAKIKKPFWAMRYNSLKIIPPDESMILAKDDNLDPMVLCQSFYLGIQFHPESFLTPQGNQLLKNYFTIHFS